MVDLALSARRFRFRFLDTESATPRHRSIQRHVRYGEGPAVPEREGFVAITRPEHTPSPLSTDVKTPRLLLNHAITNRYRIGLIFRGGHVTTVVPR